MIQCAIVGATGYTGLELIKILLNHPHFELTYLSSSEGGERIEELYPALQGVYEKELEKTDIKTIADNCSLAFLALPHKTAMEVAKPLLEAGVRVVDLSADYRLHLENYEAYYTKHTDTEHLKNAVYGLPEIFRDKIEHAQLIANPGCYPTATLLSLIPFLPFIDADAPIFIDAKSGVSGAGKKCSSKTHYITINENIFAYNPIRHRHSVEIKEKLELFGKEIYHINFVPHLLPITRGMLVSSYVTLKKSIDPIEVLRDFYADEPFVRIKEIPVDVKSVAGTHFCDIYAQCHENALFVSSAIDNLLRGASSQAVANANIMMGLPESTGLPTIAYVP
ncbi:MULTISPECIES: N-acetyl-gamma-glutamyl-phosphate reductase [unclassified Nitratiruptor]|uniref:N-acetyl-gamma-glutamyl-phosphate reductase n=1 Tax=unclassified Nitratiruptor TaxID=2624044 RepID=UPI0019157354|nr:MULTISPECIES: N-acetyl-gamma-glutamyl-phosphate reductase [unclassified Nitratiruptor]BCD60628.1 N-acetyl-gamma-glutamyl-phosphate reductase [Nitratiruptor sp. YY08-10]BCD64559.1 N-acetyl-gamma-glutamyl-phosphate reductase [Nitratiruptor sp. YY08-14]